MKTEATVFLVTIQAWRSKKKNGEKDGSTVASGGDVETHPFLSEIVEWVAEVGCKVRVGGHAVVWE